MLTIDWDQGDFSVLIGSHIGSFSISVVPSLYTMYASPAVYPFPANHDPILYGIMDTLIVKGRWSPFKALGSSYDDPATSDVTSFIGNVPEATPYNVQGDYTRYGSIFGFLAQGANWGAIASAVKQSGEHNVLHTTVAGRASANGPLLGEYLTSYSPSKSKDVYGAVIPGFSNRDSFTGSAGIWHLASFGQFSSDGVGTVPIGTTQCTLAGAVEALAEYFSGGQEMSIAYVVSRRNIRVYCRNFRFVSDASDNYTLEYDLEVRLWSAGYPVSSSWWISRHERVRVTIDSYFRVGHSVPIMSYLTPVPLDVHITVHLDKHSISMGDNFAEATLKNPYSYNQFAATLGSSSWSTIRQSIVLLSKVSSKGLVRAPDLWWKSWRPSKTPSSLYGRPITGVWDYFEANVRDDIPNLRPSAFFSTQDGLSNLIDVIKTNHVETIGELGQIAELLPSLRPIAKLLLDIRSLNLLDAGAGLLDVLASTKLLYEFGWKPTASAVVEFADKFDVLKDRLVGSGLGSEATFYGKFVYTLPEGRYGFSTPILITRTKTRIRMGSSMILSGVLGARSAGLLPSASALWDLVPFSFVVDWFMNTGERIGAIEDRATMLALPHVFSTHSYTVIDKFPSEYLDDVNLVSRGLTDLDTPHFRFYHRVVSGFFAPLEESEYDFLSASGPPDWSTAGALLYSVLR